ncbi:MAG: cytochrome c peroxidase [Vicinamibacterales bacterium]
MRTLMGALALGLACATAACSRPDTPSATQSQPTPVPAWEAENPIMPLPESPLGAEIQLASLPNAPTPAQVRLGRWLFYDTRLSADGSIACATCHKPEHAFSEPTPHSTGIRGQQGGRKAPSFVNAAVTLYPHFFWDGRAASLEEQALGPVANPIEMGATHESMIAAIEKAGAYAPYFKEAFGSDGITKERVAAAIAAYEKTRMSGNSPVDRWRLNKDESAVSDQVKQGYELFFNKAGCNQCHLGNSYTDSQFHNIGVGYDRKTKTFRDEGRSAISKDPAHRGAFKTPTLRDVAKHAPYMHDGSVATLRETVELYNRGGEPNPNLDPKIKKLNLTPGEVEALVAFMEALNGEGYMDTAPKVFPGAAGE